MLGDSRTRIALVAAVTIAPLLVIAGGCLLMLGLMLLGVVGPFETWSAKQVLGAGLVVALLRGK